jgi:hypothetical protein
MNDNSCATCRDWGRTITREENPAAIGCPDCKRLTWPNLGTSTARPGAPWHCRRPSRYY